jgi:hypothetical protein
MASPQCMREDGNPAVFVGTMLQTGDAVALCDECLVLWASALLNVMTGVDPAPFIAAISEDVPSTAEGAPSDEPPPAAPADEDQPHPTPIRAAGRGQVKPLGGGSVVGWGVSGRERAAVRRVRRHPKRRKPKTRHGDRVAAGSSGGRELGVSSSGRRSAANRVRARNARRQDSQSERGWYPADEQLSGARRPVADSPR